MLISVVTFSEVCKHLVLFMNTHKLYLEITP